MQVQQNACIMRSFVLSEKWKLKIQNCSVVFFRHKFAPVESILTTKSYFLGDPDFGGHDGKNNMISKNFV